MLKRYWRFLFTILLLSAMSLTGCTNSRVDTENAIQGKWHRVGEPNVADPLQTLASEYIELRPTGVLVSLLFDPGSQTFWTATTGAYSVAETSQIVVQGKCWQGWQSYDCSQAYRFKIRGDSLTIFENENEQRSVKYERMGAASTDLPPSLVPPMPSATPMVHL
jgi:hypothetical protein